MIAFDNASTIGQRIKQMRTELRMTQKDLAALSGVAQPTISELERGNIHGSAHLVAIAEALHVNALWLQTAQEPKSSIAPHEMLLVSAYRNATAEGKAFIESACKSAPKSYPGRDRRTASRVVVLRLGQ